MTTHWNDYHTRWARLGPPLRPNAEVATAMSRLFDAHRGPTLLLGVTPELADIGPSVTAIDRSEGMIRGVWPGDTDARRAVLGDWLSLPFADGAFVAAVGDGSPNALRYPDECRALLDGVARVLGPGGRTVLRVFRTPDEGESLGTVVDHARGGRIRSFHAFKWRFVMALVGAARSANIAVRDIHAAFTEAIPDRRALATNSGWEVADIDTIDVYKGSSEVYSFPTSDELLAAVPAAFTRATFVDTGTYELAERCPLFVLDRG